MFGLKNFFGHYNLQTYLICTGMHNIRKTHLKEQLRTVGGKLWLVKLSIRLSVK